jgi:signal transduction histidine kinase
MRQLERPATPDEVLAAVVATTAQTLKLPYVAVDLGDGADRRSVAQVGRPVAAPLRLPVRYQNEVVGQLVVSPRSPQEPFGPREVELLGDIAAQVGAVAHAVGLHAALLRSREGLVLAREEERRRIRRDLHDGLGPALASQTFKLDAALDLLGSDPEAAGEVLAELKAHTQTLVADIRRLVYELRPPALDDLGLLGALEAHIGQIRHSRGGPDVAVIADPAPLPALSAAVEVAAYRIALEGITNVLRHAHASTCRVRLALQPHSLRVEVWDDGKGIPSDVVAGVGLTSMRDRAEELGGTLTIQGRPGDNRVRAHLPLVDVTRNPAAAGGAP